MTALALSTGSRWRAGASQFFRSFLAGRLGAEGGAHFSQKPTPEVCPLVQYFHLLGCSQNSKALWAKGQASPLLQLPVCAGQSAALEGSNMHCSAMHGLHAAGNQSLQSRRKPSASSAS